MEICCVENIFHCDIIMANHSDISRSRPIVTPQRRKKLISTHKTNQNKPKIKIIHLQPPTTPISTITCPQSPAPAPSSNVPSPIASSGSKQRDNSDRPRKPSSKYDISPIKIPWYLQERSLSPREQGRHYILDVRVGGCFAIHSSFLLYPAAKVPKRVPTSETARAMYLHRARGYRKM
jgi:hypothetical protein